MSIAIPNPVTPTIYGIQSINITTCTGLERGPQGQSTTYAGQVNVTIQPCQWADDVFVKSMEPIVITDVAKWLQGLATANNPLAARAAQMFVTGQVNMLWLLQLALNLQGLADAPPSS